MIAEFETVDEFLEHHGTKGMRWGVRKETSIGSDGGKPSSSKPVTRSTSRSSGGNLVNKPQEKKGLSSGQKKALLGVGIAAGVGALFVAHHLLKNKNQNLNAVRSAKNIEKSFKQTQSLLNASKGVKVTDVRKAFAVSSSGVATPVMQRIVSL